MRSARALLVSRRQQYQLVEVDTGDAMVALERGEWAAARRAAASAERRARQAGVTTFVPALPLLAGRARLGEGRYAEAAAELSRAAALARASQLGGVEALSRALTEQAELLQGGRAKPAPSGKAPASPELEAIRAENQGLRANKPAEAADAFGRAAGAWRRIGTTVWLARALTWEAAVRPRAGARLNAE
jgi:hypothetical protein